MGNSESSPHEFPPAQPAGSRQRRENEEEDDDAVSPAVGTALKAGMALAGTALLAFGALSLASSSSSSSPHSTGRSPEGTAVSHEAKREECNRYGSGSYNDFRAPNIHYGRLAGDASTPRMVKIMSYNVCFWDVKVEERMRSIGSLISQHSPDVIFFQEVTPNIYRIFQSSEWWGAYNCSVSPETATRKYFCMLMSKLPAKFFASQQFENSSMGRDLSVAEIDTGTAPKKFFVATSHLESPTPPVMHSMERIAQARHAIRLLHNAPNAVFGGDMNWGDDLDGPFPTMEGWVDAWPELRPGEHGWTYDTESNAMIKGNRPLQKRLDRFLCKLKDFRLMRVDMIGLEAIPGIYTNHKGKLRPVLPSDHYGLLLTICTK